MRCGWLDCPTHRERSAAQRETALIELCFGQPLDRSFFAQAERVGDEVVDGLYRGVLSVGLGGRGRRQTTGGRGGWGAWGLGIAHACAPHILA